MGILRFALNDGEVLGMKLIVGGADLLLGREKSYTRNIIYKFLRLYMGGFLSLPEDE